MTIFTILWLTAIGISAAVIISYYNSSVLGKIVRNLIKIDATSPESAISLEELGMKMNFAVKNSMRPGKSLSEIIKITDDGKYYIASEKVSMAKSKYSDQNASLIFVILTIAILLLICVLFTYVFPSALKSFSNTITSLFS